MVIMERMTTLNCISNRACRYRILGMFFMVILAMTAWESQAMAENENFKPVELDSFIRRQKSPGGKQRIIKMADPVSFKARMKRYPEEKNMSYVYTALKMAGVEPLPTVDHRMFVESEQGRIIPVYVEKQAAAKLRTGLREEQSARFMGYHVYNYAKGPAILVVDFERVNE